jgi:signal transduction histidine kinase
LGDVIHLVTVEANKRDIAIDTDLEETPQATLDEDQMKQVFLNIFLNAIDATFEHGRISVTSRDIKKNGVEYVQVEIADNGKGIPKKILDNIFDPFFTTKAKGVGLGLSISHQIVQEHNGTIEVESRAKKGTTFVVNIPCET